MMRDRGLFLVLVLIIIVHSIIVPGVAAFQTDRSEEKVVSIVYVGEKGDFSYLERAFLGLSRAQDEFPFSLRDIPWNTSVPVDPVTDAGGIRSDAVIIMGDIMNGYEQKVIRQYPEVPVILIDGGEGFGPETRSVDFSMYGASYLAGILAANQTKTGKVGVIAGVDAPVLRGFTDGFTDGAYREDPDASVNISYIATDYSGFSMPERAGGLTADMYRNGTDIIYQIAGSSGTGVIDTAKTLPGMYIIGSDSDQSGMAPGTVMASAVKSLDSVIYQEMRDVFSGSYSPGSEITGLKEGGSSLVVNPRFANLSPVVEMRKEEAIEREKEYLASHPLT